LCYYTPLQEISEEILCKLCKQGFGCILADFMGLGKTLQVVATSHTFLTTKTIDEDGEIVNKWDHVLILSPAICVRNWEAEFKKWLPLDEVKDMNLCILESAKEKSMKERVLAVRKWYQRGGVMVMGYELYRNLILLCIGEEKATQYAVGKKQLEEVYGYLCKPGPDLIVLDEGHRIRDPKSKLVKALSHVP